MNTLNWMGFAILAINIACAQPHSNQDSQTSTVESGKADRISQLFSDNFPAEALTTQGELKPEQLADAGVISVPVALGIVFVATAVSGEVAFKTVECASPAEQKPFFCGNSSYVFGQATGSKLAGFLNSIVADFSVTPQLMRSWVATTAEASSLEKGWSWLEGRVRALSLNKAEEYEEECKELPSALQSLCDNKGVTVLFGQRRVSAQFATINSTAPSWILGKNLNDVADTLEKEEEFMLIKVFDYNGTLVAINNRALAAVSLSGRKPRVFEITITTPTKAELNRLSENPVSGFPPLPAPLIPATKGPKNDEVLFPISIGLL